MLTTFIFPILSNPFLGFSVILLILTLRQIIRLLKEKKNIKTDRIINLSVTLILFVLTFYNFNKIPNSIIEKIDWSISYNKRGQIVKDILTEKLKPNTKLNNGICRLSFDFPIISNGGNDIWIYQNKTEGEKLSNFGFLVAFSNHHKLILYSQMIRRHKSNMKN